MTWVIWLFYVHINRVLLYHLLYLSFILRAIAVLIDNYHWLVTTLVATALVRRALNYVIDGLLFRPIFYQVSYLIAKIDTFITHLALQAFRLFWVEVHKLTRKLDHFQSLLFVDRALSILWFWLIVYYLIELFHLLIYHFLLFKIFVLHHNSIWAVWNLLSVKLIYRFWACISEFCNPLFCFSFDNCILFFAEDFLIYLVDLYSWLTFLR